MQADPAGPTQEHKRVRKVKTGATSHHCRANLHHSASLLPLTCSTAAMQAEGPRRRLREFGFRGWVKLQLSPLGPDEP